MQIVVKNQVQNFFTMRDGRLKRILQLRVNIKVAQDLNDIGAGLMSKRSKDFYWVAVLGK